MLSRNESWLCRLRQRQPAGRFAACIRNEEAQASVDYIIVVFFMVLAVVGTTRLFSSVLSTYLKRVFYIVSLPLP